jgi:hypothetical protein
MIDNLTKAFNAVFRELLILCRAETGSSEVKSAIKRVYKKFDSDTSSHIEAFQEDGENLCGFPFVKTLADFEDSSATEQAFHMHECMLVLSKLQALAPAPCVADVVIGAMAKGDPSAVAGVVLDKTLAEELVTAIGHMSDELRAALPVPKAGQDIMTIARDVSKSIDIESIMRNGMDPNSASMQDMLSNVSRDIQGRIDSGDVDQDALMEQATAMLAGLGGAGGMGELMKAMMKS